MHKIFGTEVVTQKRFVHQLTRVKRQLMEGSVTPDNQTELLSVFDGAINAGKKIAALTPKHNPTACAKEISEPLLKRLNDEKEKGLSPFLGIVPITISIDNKPVPLSLLFRREKDKIYMEIKGLHERLNTPLKPEYEIQEGTAKETIPHIIHAFLDAYTQENLQSKAPKLSYREKIRLKNLERLSCQPLPLKGLEKQPKDVSQKRLHEMLCNFSTPVKSDLEKAPSSQDPLFAIFKSLDKAFPHSVSMDKLEWLLCSMEEEYAALQSSLKSLSVEDKAQFSKHFENHMLEFQKHLKKIPDLAQAPKVFQDFSARLEAIKQQQIAINAEVQHSQNQVLNNRIKTQAQKKLIVSLPEGMKTRKVTSKNTQSKERVLNIDHDTLLASLKDHAAKSNYKELCVVLNMIHRASDTLIEQKQYALAQYVSLSALQALPVPEFTSSVNTTGPENVRELMASCVTSLSQDIWETSLRLNATYCPPEQIVQLMKAQIINRALHNQYHSADVSAAPQIDYTEFKKILHLHPHMRFGWKSAHFSEIRQMIDFMEKDEPNTQEIRKDTSIPYGEQLTVPTNSFKGNGVRLQAMMSCLMKPGYCLSPFFGAGRLEQVQGLAWLDGLESKAIGAGANTPQEIKKNIQEIRLKIIQERLSKINRLEFGTGIFVTEHQCLTIVDAKDPAKPLLAYLPNGYGLPYQFENKYGLEVSQENTRPLAGRARGEGRFIGDYDEMDLGKRGLRDCLSPQLALTEPSLYELNCQLPPQGQISQVENYLIDAAQVSKSPETVSLNPGSIVEGLNILFNERNLGDPEIQRSLMLLLSRTLLLEKTVREHPLEMLAIADQLKKLVETKAEDPLIFPFLLQIGQIIKDEAVVQSEIEKKKGQADRKSQDHIQRLDAIAASIPCYDNGVKAGNKTQTGQQWLKAMLRDPNGERAAAASAYMYATLDRPIDSISNEMMPEVLIAASIFSKLDDGQGVPVLNAKVNEWVTATLLPQLSGRIQSEGFDLSVIDTWMQGLLSPKDLARTSPWTIEQRDPLVLGNQDHQIAYSSLQVSSKQTKEVLGKIKTQIPAQVQQSLQFLKLFGTSPINAELTRGEDPDLFIYTFPFGPLKTNYQVIYNQKNGKVTVKCQFLPEKGTKNIEQPWYIYTDQFSSQGDTAVEQAIQKNGLWINEKKPKMALFATAPLTEGKRKDFYRIALDKKGALKQVRTLKENAPVALLKEKQTAKILPFGDPATTFVILSPWGKIRQIRNLSQKTVFTRTDKGQWKFVDPRMGDPGVWVTDLPSSIAALQSTSPQQDTQYKRFFDSFGKDFQQFLLPVRQGKEIQCVINPYTIRSLPNADVHIDHTHPVCAATDTPLIISFDQDGELKGSPSAFAYLAYYFAMKRDLNRASFYMKKAKHVPASSEQERMAFEKIAALFHQIPHRSVESLGFQLKTQLILRDILRTQFSRTHYQRASEAEFFAGITHVTDLYKQYLAKKTSLHEKSNWSLSAEEEYAFDRIRWTTFENWIEKQKEVDIKAASDSDQRKVHEVPGDVFLSTKITEKRFSEIQQTSAATILLNDFSRPPIALDKLLEKGRLDTEYLIRHFFDYYEAITSIKKDDAGKLDDLLQIILSKPTWEINLSKTEEDLRLARLASDLRLTLAIVCIFKKIDSNAKLPQFDRKALAKFQKTLPYWDRDMTRPGKFILGMYDNIRGNPTRLGLKVGELVDEKFDRIFSAIQALSPDITIGEYLRYTPPRHKAAVEIPTGKGVSLETISQYMQGLKKGEHFHLPIEVTELVDLIKSEKNADQKKLHDIMALIRESESRDFPILAIRALSELMREIHKTEKEIIAQKTIQPEMAVGEMDFAPLMASQSKLLTEVSAFNTLSEKDKQDQGNLKETLKKKHEIAEKYFLDKNAASPAMKEEFQQLRSGLAIAKKGLEEELQKSDFSESELKAFQSFLKKHTQNPNQEADSIVSLYQSKREKVLALIKALPLADQPKSLRKIVTQMDLYTDLDLIRAVQKMYKTRVKSSLVSKWPEMEQNITEMLFYMTAHQQLNKARELLTDKPTASLAAKALNFVLPALSFDRYLDESKKTFKNPLIAKKCLVAEARSSIIYRPGQRKIIDMAAEDPKQWASLRMGLGKTSYAIPTIVEILAEQGRSVVVTVPDKLLKSNRKDFDRATRLMFDQAGMEFSVELVKDIPINLLAEKALQIENIFKGKGYIVTTVEELATLHDTCLLLEDEKLKLFNKPEGLTGADEKRLLMMELRLHYYKKIDRLLTGEATELDLPHSLFGDETDDTHAITREVNIAIGEKVDPAIEVRQVSRAILETIVHSKNPKLTPLKTALLTDTFPVLTPVEISGFMKEIAKEFLSEKRFLSLLGDQQIILQNVNPEEWANYLTGSRENLPGHLPEWCKQEGSLQRAQKMIGSAKQLLTATFPNFLSQKSGNDVGFSDDEAHGYLVVPKATKNETPGMRHGDEFEMIFAQYLGYFEFTPCQSLTGSSTTFIEKGLKSFKEKSPESYKKFLHDYQQQVEIERAGGRPHLEFIDFLKMPQSYMHRWNILDDVVMDGGYIKRYHEQVNTNVQELFHRRSCGGVTGTLDPYVLPFISEEVSLHKGTEKEVSSTREVEAETFLRLGLNIENGLDQAVSSYNDQDPMEAFKAMLKDPSTSAMINSSGAGSEGLDTLSWIAALRKTEEGRERSYLFMHPGERIPYLWSDQSMKAIPYKGQELPGNLICMYAPSDVRGVDLPIRKGKVRMLVSPTASLQELVQSLYRARQLGGDHELMLHLPLSLHEKIAEGKPKGQAVTYGDTLVYLINRTAPVKLDLNLKAQLSKVQFELKTTLSRYLKEINPDIEQHEFLSKEGFETIGRLAKSQSVIFEKLRKLYIKSKEIQFEGCYSPREMTTGIQKVLDEYTALQKQIDDLLPEISQATMISFAILNEGKEEKVIEEIEDAFTNLYQTIRDVPEYKELGERLLSISASWPVSKKDLDLILKAMMDAHLEIDRELKQNPDSSMASNLQHLKRLLTESLYGKGKSHLYNTLRGLSKDLDTQKAAFQANQAEHEKYLPEKTTKNRIGDAGANEQVKEMQQQKTTTQEAEPKDPALAGKSNRPARSYQPLDMYSLVSSFVIPEGNNLPVVPLNITPPFDQFYISPEALDLLNVVPMMQGAPLVYIAVNEFKNSNKPPKITLISKQDYEAIVKDQLRGKEFSGLSVYAPVPDGVRFVNGGSDKHVNGAPDHIKFSLMTIKAYLGYTDEFAKDTPARKAWVDSLSDEDRKGILTQIRRKGSPSQQKIFDDLF